MVTVNQMIGMVKAGVVKTPETPDELVAILEAITDSRARKMIQRDPEADKGIVLSVIKRSIRKTSKTALLTRVQDRCRGMTDSEFNAALDELVGAGDVCRIAGKRGGVSLRIVEDAAK